MTYIRTGRFDYRIETDNPSLQWQALHGVYADIIRYAEKVRSEPKCPEQIKLQMNDIINGSDSHIAAIAEALEPLPNERKALLYYLIRHRLIDAYSIAYAVGDIRLARAVNRRTQIMRAKRHPNTASIAAAITAAAHAIGEDVPKRVECMIVEVERASGLKVSKRRLSERLDPCVILQTTQRRLVNDAGLDATFCKSDRLFVFSDERGRPWHKRKIVNSTTSVPRH